MTNILQTYLAGEGELAGKVRELVNHAVDTDATSPRANDAIISQ